MGVSVQLFQQAWDRSSARRAGKWWAHRLRAGQLLWLEITFVSRSAEGLVASLHLLLRCRRVTGDFWCREERDGAWVG